MNDAAKLKSNWQTALSACHLNPRGLAREIGISHTYLYAIIAGKIFPSEHIRTRLLNRLKGYGAGELFGPVIPARMTTAGIICKRCHSAQIIKSGVFKGSQRYINAKTAAVSSSIISPFFAAVCRSKPLLSSWSIFLKVNLWILSVG